MTLRDPSHMRLSLEAHGIFGSSATPFTDNGAIVSSMLSVADLLRAEDHAAVLALPVSDRAALALALGARDLESFRLAQDPPLDSAAAARILDQRRQAGRRPSRCIEELIG